MKRILFASLITLSCFATLWADKLPEDMESEPLTAISSESLMAISSESPDEPGIMDGYLHGEQSGSMESGESSFFAPEHGKVNLSGSYAFNYPLQIPPGREDLTPSISLQYDSARMSENSLVGCGWTLSMPAIRRFNRYGIEQMYERNHFYSPDGQELVAVSTNGVVHEYRLRIEGEFARYFYDTVLECWHVYDRSGIQYIYGRSANERVAEETHIYAWYLTEKRDPQDNCINYTYSQQYNSIYPDKIFYTGHGETPGSNRVEFVWENRPDPIEDYSAGFEVNCLKRLTGVQSFSGTNVATRYTVAYETGLTGRSRIRQIQRVGTDGTSVLPPLTLSYEDQTQTVMFERQDAYNLPDGLWLSRENSTDPQALPADSGVRFADINGDGLNDLLYGRGQSGEKKVWINTGSGWERSLDWSLPVYFSEGTDKEPDPSGAVVIDLNGDNRADILRGYSRTDKAAYINTGSGWVQDNRWRLPDDIAFRAHFDGLTYTGEGGSPPSQDDWPSDYISLNVQFPDLNGDGRPDLVYAVTNATGSLCETLYEPYPGGDPVPYGAIPWGQKIWLNSETGWVETTDWTLPDGGMLLADLGNDSYNLPDDGCLRFADLNGDGLSDLLYANGHERGYEHDPDRLPGNTRRAWLNTGSGWQRDDRWILPDMPNGLKYFIKDLPNPGDGHPGFVSVGLRLADLNGDGLTDIYLSHWYEDAFLGRQYDQIVNWACSDAQSQYDSAVSDCEGAKSSCYESCSGWTPCSTCAGSGITWVRCPTCNGTTLCPSCNGSQFITCTICGGLGYKSGECTVCSGDGSCPYCDGGCGDCTMCGGSGICPACSGTGIVSESCPVTEPCMACNATGECPGCGGTGWVEIPCPICQGTGYVPYDKCDECDVDCDPGFSCASFYGIDTPFIAEGVWLNTGSGWARQDQFFPADMPSPMCIGGTETLVTSDYGDFDGKAFGHTGLEIIDVTGDGIPEFIQACAEEISGFSGKLVYSGRDGSERMVRKQNGLGGGTLLTYKSARETEDFQSPQVPRVVDTFTLYDGLGLSYTTRYDYAGGWYFVDTNGTRRSEFRGFHERTVTDSEGVTKVAYYHQGGGVDGSLEGEYEDHEAKKFHPYREETYGTNGLLYTSTISKWDMAAYTDPAEPNETRYWAKKTDEIEFDFTTGGAHKEFAVQTVYNEAVGLPTAIKRYGQVSGTPADGAYGSIGTGDDETYTFFEYESFTSQTNMVDKPSRIRVCSADNDSTSERLKETRYSYTADGLLECSQAWWDTANSFITNQYVADYDDYGNPLEIHDAAGLVTEITYDDMFHQYPQRTDRGGHVTLSDFDSRSGQPLFITDAAGMTLSNRYDVFLRPSGVWKDGVLLQEMEYHLSGVNAGQRTSDNWIHTMANVGGGQIADSYVYADGLGREIQTRTESERGDGTFRVTSTIYDEQGRITEAFEPRFGMGGDFVPFDNPFNPAVTYEYDALGRVSKMTPREGDDGSPTAPTYTSYEYGSDPWVVVVTDALGIEHRYFKNAWDQTLKVEEDVEGQTARTIYAYDRLQRLTDTFDPDMNRIRLFYDSLDRKTQMIDPDMGTWSYGYDAAGRMTNQTDAVGNRIVFEYDVHSRPETKRIYDAFGVLEDTVAFTYDSSDDAGFSVHTGQLYRVVQNGVTNRFSYDTHGNILKTELSLAGQGSWTATNSYDELDRPDVTAYPGAQAAVQYGYGPVGNLEAVSSVYGTGEDGVTLYHVDSFNELGQVEAVSYGNGIQSQFAYYSNSRRLRQSTSHHINGGALQYLSYTFNEGGLMTSISDHLYEGKLSSTYNDIQYDDLNRLTSVRYDGESSPKTYAYDLLGNITRNDDYDDSKTYSYSGTRPHSVTSIGSDTFQYDANGNLTNQQSSTISRQCTYDAQNRLIHVVTDKDIEVYYAYLDSGQRLSKTVIDHSDGRTNTTLYIGPGYEEHIGDDGEETLCHVFFDSKRVATFSPVPAQEQVVSTLPISDQQLASALAGTALTPNAQSLTPSSWERTYASNGTLIRYVSYAVPKALADHAAPFIALLATVLLLAHLAHGEGCSSAKTQRNVRQDYRIKSLFTFNSSCLRGHEILSILLSCPKILLSLLRSVRSFAADIPLHWRGARRAGWVLSPSKFFGSGFDIRYSAKKVLCCLFSLAVFVQPSYAQSTFQRGDVNGDGKVDIADALLIQQVVDGQRDLENNWDMAPLVAGYANGDINYDGAVNATDARIIMEYCVGLRDLPEAPSGSQRMMYYHDDHLGSTGIVTDRVGNVVQHITYTPYGEMRHEMNLGTSVNYLYTGQEFDREIGLYYYGARYYDQSVGRFISADTIIPDPTDSQAYNRYSYCLDNPIMYVDSTGHWAHIAFGALVGATIGAVVAYRAGGDANAIGAAALGGAVAGGLMASGVGLVAGAASTGALTGAEVVGSCMIAGASSSTIGNTVEQAAENFANGQSLGESLANVDFSEQLNSMATGALGGAVSGGLINAGEALKASGKAAASRVQSHGKAATDSVKNTAGAKASGELGRIQDNIAAGAMRAEQSTLGGAGASAIEAADTLNDLAPVVEQELTNTTSPKPEITAPGENMTPQVETPQIEEPQIEKPQIEKPQIDVPSFGNYF